MPAPSTSAPPPPTPGLRRPQIKKAAAALLAHAKAVRAKAGGLFDDDDEFVYMIVSLKKVPQESRNDKPVRLPIPHPIYTFDGAEVCLFVKDAPNNGGAKAAKAKAADQKLAAAAGVSRVLAASKLKTKFEPYEAKRKLAAAYDLFLADARVLRALPRVLGKAFLKAKKQPIPVDLSRKDWAKPVRDAVTATYLFRGGGSCLSIKVARTGMSSADVADNVQAALAGALPHVAKQWAGVASIMLKLASSAALPVYQTVDKREAAAEGAAAEGAVAVEA